MTRPSATLSRRLAPLALGLALACSSAPAWAQQPDPPPEGDQSESKGRPVDGYIATAVLAAVALFAISKSARR
jgi:hypothetical protein